jgi:hypothetical protein
MNDPRQLHPEHHPTPFTAEEIRRGCPPRRRTLIRTTKADGNATYTISEFTRHEGDGTFRTSALSDAEGTPVGESTESFSTWLELQSHASMPKAVTTVEETQAQLPIGDQKCLLYTVRTSESITRFTFALSLPGMPARVVEERNGKLAWTMEIVSDTQAGR